MTAPAVEGLTLPSVADGVEGVVRIVSDAKHATAEYREAALAGDADARAALMAHAGRLRSVGVPAFAAWIEAFYCGVVA